MNSVETNVWSEISQLAKPANDTSQDGSTGQDIIIPKEKARGIVCAACMISKRSRIINRIISSTYYLLRFLENLGFMA